MTLLFPTPVLYDGNEARFLQRDGARFAQALERAGDHGIKVILSKGPECPAPMSPLLRAGSWDQWLDPSFWRSFGADGALCYFGFATKRFLPVLAAMRQADLPLALKMDSALGINAFPRYFFTEFRRAYWFLRQTCGPFFSFARAACRAFGPAVRMDSSRTIKYVEAFDVLTAESPLARDNTIRWLRQRGRGDLADKIVLLHHPVPDSFVPPASKQNQILAVAQDWSNPLKGGTILQSAFRVFLSRHPDWRATIIGKNSERFDELRSTCGNRASLCPALSSEELLPHYQNAKILCIASGSESGPIVAFEALACGCSIVFPPSIPQLEWIARSHIGAMAPSRTPAGLVNALESECAAWNDDPNRAIAASSGLPPLNVRDCLADLLRNLFPKTAGTTIVRHGPGKVARHYEHP